MLFRLIIQSNEDYIELCEKVTFMFRTDALTAEQKVFVEKVLKLIMGVNEFVDYAELIAGLEDVFGLSDVRHEGNNKWKSFVITDQKEINRLTYNSALASLQN